jgi:hypothetical protein
MGIQDFFKVNIAAKNAFYDKSANKTYRAFCIAPGALKEKEHSFPKCKKTKLEQFLVITSRAVYLNILQFFFAKSNRTFSQLCQIRFIEPIGNNWLKIGLVQLWPFLFQLLEKLDFRTCCTPEQRREYFLNHEFKHVSNGYPNNFSNNTAAPFFRPLFVDVVSKHIATMS